MKFWIVTLLETSIALSLNKNDGWETTFLMGPGLFSRATLVLWSVTWICLCQTHNLILPILLKVFFSPMDSFVGFNDLIFVARTKGEKMVRRVETRDPWRSCGS